MKRILIISLVFLVGCGARKTQKESFEIKADVNDTLAVNISSGSKKEHKLEAEKLENAVVTWQENERTLSPADPDKPMSETLPDGTTTTWYNTTVKDRKATGSETRETKERTAETTAQSDTTAIKVNSAHKEGLEASGKKKGVDKKQAVNLNLIFGLAIGLCVLLLVIYLIWRYERKNNKVNAAENLE